MKTIEQPEREAKLHTTLDESWAKHRELSWRMMFGNLSEHQQEQTEAAIAGERRKIEIAADELFELCGV